MPKKHILIVDDEEAIRSILVDLMNYFGYEAVSADGGLQALKLVENNVYDLIITDINMPDLNGLDLIRRVKSTKPDIDLIAITGFDVEYRYTDVIAVGASDFIVKPFEHNELQAKINRVFREQDLRRELEKLSIKDGLTDLFNRRYFEQRLLKEMIRAFRQKYPLFLFIIDIDHFKLFNDTYGHQAGDRLLKELAAAINHSIRQDVDIGFRYGGDEFGAIVPQVNREQALMIAQRIIDHYRESDPSKMTSISVGIASMIQEDVSESEKAECLIKRADDALFRAKREGGGRFEIEDIIL